MRIAVGGLATECSTFSPLLSTLEPFRIREGAELLDEAEYPFSGPYESRYYPNFTSSSHPWWTGSARRL